jgi:hypothetical protein
LFVAHGKLDRSSLTFLSFGGRQQTYNGQTYFI